MSGRGRIAGLLSLIIAVGSRGFGSVAKSEIVIQGTVPRSPSNGCLANVEGLCFKEQVSKLSTMLFKDDLAIRRFLETHCALVISVVSEGDDASRCAKSLGGLLKPKVAYLKKMVGNEAKFCVFMGEYEGALDINVLLDLGIEDDWDKNIPPTLMDELSRCPQREYMVFTKNLGASNYRVGRSKKQKFLWQKTRDFKFDYSSRAKPAGDWSSIWTADGLIYFVYREVSATKAKTNCLLDTDACSQSDNSDSSNISIPEEGPFRLLVSNYSSPVNRNKSVSRNNRAPGRLVKRTVKTTTVTEEYYEEEYYEEKSDPDDVPLTSLRLGLLTKNALHFS